jgi:protein phosphatase
VVSTPGEYWLRAAAGANASALATGFQFTYAGAHLVAVSAGQGESAEAIAAEALDAVRAHDTHISEATLSESAHAMAWDVQQRVAPRIPNLSIPTGTSMTTLMFTETSLAVVQMGVTRAYVLRDGMMFQITHEHRLCGVLADGQAAFPWATRLYGGHADAEPDFWFRELHPCDRYLVCSPALAYLLDAEEIYDVLVRGDNLTATVRGLVERVGPAEHIVACAVVDVPPYLPR